MMELKELYQQRGKINETISKIETKQKIQENQQFIRRYFKFRNSYSSDEKWWMYSYVRSIDKDGNCIGWSFQDDKNGRITINIQEIWYGCHAFEKEISRKEFYQAWAKILDKLPGRLKSNAIT